MSKRLILTTRALCLSAALFTSSHLVAAADWESLPPLPEPNGGCAVGTDGSSVYVAGGTNWQDGTKHWLRKVWRFNPASKTWSAIGDLPSPCAYGISGTWINAGPAFLFGGGSDGEKQVTRIHWVENNGLKQREAEIPFSCVLSAGGVLDRYLIFVGGTYDASKLSHLSAKTWALDLTSNEVIRFPDYPGDPFGTAASTVGSDGLFVFGGANWDSATESVRNSAAACLFSVIKNSWRKLKPLPNPVRGLSAVLLQQGLVYLAGGFKSDDEGFSSEALIYELRTDTYRKAKSLPYAAMVGLVKHDDFVYCIGGEDKMKHRSDKFFRIAVSELTSSR